MAELTLPTFFLIPSLIIALALWVLEGLCPLTLKEFLMEQLHVSMHFLALISLPLEVTWLFYIPSGVWGQFGCPWHWELGEGDPGFEY